MTVMKRLAMAGLAAAMLIAPLVTSANAESRNGRMLPSREMIRQNAMSQQRPMMYRRPMMHRRHHMSRHHRMRHHAM